jgi:hypothetical protein
VKLPQFPMQARWTANRDIPQEVEFFDEQAKKRKKEIRYEQDGQIFQAEEVLENGQWKRYYGFAGIHQLARVPAAEIEFPPDWHPRVELPNGWDAGLLVPGADDEEWLHLPLNKPVPIKLMVLNRTGLDMAAPLSDSHLRLQLQYSPAKISRQGMLVPTAGKESDWVEVGIKTGARLPQPNKDILPPAEEIKSESFDLGNHFDLSRPGFYRLHLLPRQEDKSSAEHAPVEIRFSQF